ncbi:hypothetical protein Csa_010117 [Cucumis sativus]|uniref:Uncharacterized protein n=1 Tax=Cucumis sativus TaxID=3659 RepID=A0A0A0L634_CUCSA|nr:hypothetical protein Csa_010117 [Cucumis sativus]
MGMGSSCYNNGLGADQLFMVGHRSNPFTKWKAATPSNCENSSDDGGVLDGLLSNANTHSTAKTATLTETANWTEQPHEFLFFPSLSLLLK